MADTVIFEDATKRILRATSDGNQPGTAGYWESLRIEWKPGSVGANEATVRARAAAALTANATYLAIATPNNAQVAAQVRTLTKECSAVIRLLLGLLADVSDTA